MDASSARVGQSRLDVMNFLNEIADAYPRAISFAAGRPAEAFFDIQRYLQQLPRFIRYLEDRHQVSFDSAFNTLAQYGPTRGIINDLIARQVTLDEGIRCGEDRVLVTAGCQEAMDLCVTALCRDEDDVVLVRTPTYIGITGVADLNGIEIMPFAYEHDDEVMSALEQAVVEVERRGKRPRVLYLVPDFDNPTGSVLSRTTREDIIGLCARKRIVVLEDNPYGLFRYEGDRIPRMAALDKYGCVIYLGTYSKTLCPALRVGFGIVPENLMGDAAAARALLNTLCQMKSFATVNTGQIAQAIIGAVLLVEDGSLAKRVAPAIAFYHRNRDVMVDALHATFKEHRDEVKWNVPEGGFFLPVSLPFPFKHSEAELCARDYGVLTMPMSFFALNGYEDHRVRLAFSHPSPGLIQEGINRFGCFVRDRLAA